MATERPTMQTVAAAAGVSVMTVSNAYNRPDQLTQGTRERVLLAATQLGYPGPDPAAQSLRRRSTGAIGVVLTARLTDAFTDPGLVTILHGIASELSDAGRALLLVPTRAGENASPVRQAMADALVLCHLAAADPAVTDALSRRIPVVTIGHPRLAGVPLVGIDNRRAAALAADHLLALGHQRFCVLTFREGADRSARPSIAVRGTGFTGALADAGIEPGGILCQATENTIPAAVSAISEVLAQPPGQRPTAIFAVTDVLALGVLAAARGAGVAVPAQVSVVGFDDVAEAAVSSPPLTTVSQSLFLQGQAAAQIVLRRIGGERIRPPRLTAELVVRGSTAQPPGNAGR